MDYLIADIKMFNPDIIGVTESWTDDKKVIPRFRSMGLYCLDRIG